MPDSISPRDKALTLMTFWWVVAAAAILGGLAGMGVHALKPPVYEAQARITMGIDFYQTGYMEQFDKDLALVSAAGIIYSADVMNQVVSAANAQGIPVDYDTLKNAATFERKSYEWILRLRYPDAGEAADLANLWVEHGISALDTAYQHALAAADLQVYMNSLTDCLQQVAVNAAVPVCPPLTAADLQVELSLAENRYFSEKQAARSIFPGMTYTVTQPAAVPQQPVLYGRNNLAAAGLLFGLIAGIGLVSSGFPSRIRKKE
jgi:hypothetical protein